MVTKCTEVSGKDFAPFQGWGWAPTSYEYFDPVFDYGGQYERDEGTGRLYMLQSDTTLRLKNVGLIVWTVAAHVMVTAARVFNMLTLYAFKYDNSLPLKNRMYVFGKDLEKLALTPSLILSLEMVALFGVFFPKEGRKLYATFERFAHIKAGISGLDLFCRPSPYCAPCYQPYFGMSHPPKT